ncbi:hypothetical protein [Methylosinus sp. R-45379]|uniref:hypothetical protein n=1 Tax=Methylosinus sp. R-45379 TaxID=980563 RepID=UPI000AD22B8E|nr:hypothetical protein [Methylosinus sp. R-45379]
MNQHREISAAAKNSTSNDAGSTPANARLLRLFQDMGAISVGDLLGPDPDGDDQKLAEDIIDLYDRIGTRVAPERLSWSRRQA